MNNQPYNVGLSDANLSKLELCERIQKHLPDFVFLEAPIGEDPDKRDYIVSNAKIERTGFAPEWSIDRGIQDLIKGYTVDRPACQNRRTVPPQRTAAAALAPLDRRREIATTDTTSPSVDRFLAAPA